MHNRFCFTLYILITACAAFGQQDSLRIYFGIAKTNLLPHHMQRIDSFILRDSIRENIGWKLISSADYLGGGYVNQKISDARLKGVSGYLEEKYSINPGTIQSASLGEISSSSGEEHPEGEIRHRSVLIVKEVADTTDDLSRLTLMEVGGTLRLKNLNFQPGRHVLLPGAVPELKRLLKVLQEHENLKIEIHGHICCLNDPRHSEGMDIDTGTRNLSVNRAQNIYTYLVSNGIDSSRLAYQGFGVTQRLIYPERTAEDMMRNRRVELKIVGK